VDQSAKKLDVFAANIQLIRYSKAASKLSK